MLAKTAKDFDIIHITSVFLFASTLGRTMQKNIKTVHHFSSWKFDERTHYAQKQFFEAYIHRCIEKYNLRNTIHFTADIERKNI